jgi:predicted chitinase
MADRSPSDFCPYKGLLPYTESDRQYFFGRKRDQEIIASNLYAAPLTVLHGASGVGKTSVLMAGVVPALRETPRLAVIYFRNWQGAEFAISLKNELLRVFRENLGEGIDDAFSPLEGRLARGTGNVAQERLNDGEVRTAIALSKQRMKDEPDVDLSQCRLDTMLWICTAVLRAPIFLLLDQFEEYFLYHPPSEASHGFEAEFARLVNRRDIDVSVLLSMRDEGLSKLDRFEGRIPGLLNNTLRVEHLDRESAREAILMPLEVYNKQLPPEQKVSIESALVERLLDKAKPDVSALSEAERLGGPEDDGNRRIETPVLQILLTRLWSKEIAPGSRLLRLQTFEKTLGGEKQIVRTYLNEVLESLSDTEREIASRLFKFLVTPTGAKQAQEVNALSYFAGVDRKQTQALVTRLSTDEKMRILRKDVDLSLTERYEIFHDVLALAVKEWLVVVEKEQERINSERLAAEERRKQTLEAAQRQRELEQAQALAVAEHSRAEAERRQVEQKTAAARRLKILAAALAMVTLIALVGAAYAWKQRQHAREAEVLAELNAQIAKEQSELADESARQAEKALLISEDLRKEALDQKTAAEVARKSEAKQRVAAQKALRQMKIAEAGKLRAEKETEDIKRQLGLISEGRTNVQAENATQSTVRNSLRNVEPHPNITPGLEVTRVTEDVLKRIMPNLSAEEIKLYLTPMQKAMQEFDINTPLRQAAFLAQIAFESAQLKYLEEKWDPKTFTFQQRYEPPGPLADKLGNTQQGDGRRFRGRGAIQITGRSNYQTFGDVFKVDLVGNPDLALEPELTFRIAAGYWKAYGLNELADEEDVRRITKLINGGNVGLDRRKKYYEVAKKILVTDGTPQ